MTSSNNGLEYICEVWVAGHFYGSMLVPGEWLPAEGSDWGTREVAVATAAAWEDEGYQARITSREVAQ